MSPRVCVLGETLDKAIQLLDTLCDANPDDIFRRRHGVGIMNDGTVLVVASLDNYQDLLGWEFDYVFYEFGCLVPYCRDYGPAMEYLEQQCLVHSAVPREFQWCPVDY